MTTPSGLCHRSAACDAHVGDLIDVQWLLPNWPWAYIAEGQEAIASCTSLRTSPGEMIALAFDALQPGGLMKSGNREWIQPPTRYNAMGVIRPGPFADSWPERELVTLERLRYVASPPPTARTIQPDGHRRG